MEYVEPAAAKELGGLRLALTVGVPGPWSESAKGIFHIKDIAFTPVAQQGGLPNDELLEWTGHRNAPVAVYEDEPARASWDEILMLAERIAPGPPLVPDNTEERVAMFGICHEICGEWGFGWARRLTFIHELATLGDKSSDIERMVASVLGKRYGYTPEAAERAPVRVAQILGLIAGRLHKQRKRGSRYLIGMSLSAADIYWACFAALIEPLAADVNPMPDMIRAWYSKKDTTVTAAIDPIVLEHRDHIYKQHLKLPLDF